MIFKNKILVPNFEKTSIVIVLTALCFSLLIPTVSTSEIIRFNDSWGEAGFNLISQDGTNVEVVYSITELTINDLETDGQSLKVINVPGIFLPNEAGAPNLPVTSRYIAVPQGARAEVKILSSRTTVMQDIDIAPAPPIPLETDDSPPVYVKNPDIYSHNAYYPSGPAALSEPTRIRGVDVVLLGITPFQYNPVTRELIIYQDLRVEVDFIGGNGHFGEDRLRSRYWEPILKGNLLNYESLSAVNFNRLPNGTDDDNLEYIIIVPDDPDFIAWADTIKQWRNQQGIITGVVPLSEIGGNDAALIQTYIITAYYTWQIPPVAILLLSDYQYSGDLYGITSPIYNNYCVSDNLYADMNGSGLPDIAMARITAQDAGDLESMITKLLDYERDPPTDPNFYDHPLMTGGWQTDRWFILCAEIVGGYFSTQHNKNPEQEYSIVYGSTPGSQWSTGSNWQAVVNYFGPYGLGYVPADPTYLTNWTGSAYGVNAAINSGAFLVLHRDHGYESGWGDPSYNIGHLSGLNNDMFPYVFSVNCLTGKYNHYSQVFVEAFHRMEQGALGLIGASEVSYSYVNDAYTWGVFDGMWPDFDPGYGLDLPGAENLRPCFGNSFGKYYLEATSFTTNQSIKETTYNLFHHHGDAFITLYSEMPEELSVFHQPVLFSGAEDFMVTADSGAIVSLTVDDEIIGVAEATGASMSIPIEPQQAGNVLLITATLQNHYRFSEEVDIVPQAETYVIYHSHEINDSGGNGNGQLDFGEDVMLSITVRNAGTVAAEDVNVVISTEDDYVTVLDSVEIYASVPAGSTVTVEDGFEIEAAGDIPDLHEIHFTLTASDSDTSWISYFTIIGHSPVVVFEEIAIEDPGGNNNQQLDPGETVDFHITVMNNGSADAPNLQVVLNTDNPMISISNDTVIIDLFQAGMTAEALFSDVTAYASMPQGTNVDFTLNFDAEGGYAASDGFSIVVGNELFLPSGPDEYGYYAYDMYDGSLAPQYSWVEIAPMAGGAGNVLPIGANQAIQVDLPFDFQFYGMEFNRITVCSNGGMAFDSTGAFIPVNLGIPHTIEPNNIIAAFWDDLVPDGGSQICWYYDVGEHRMILEWYEIPHTMPPGSRETFQIILLDPDFYPTPTGDGEIIVNYHTVSDQTGWCTLGIENGLGNVGLQYLYNSSYAEHAMPLENGFAIKYTTNTYAGSDLTITLEPLGTPIIIPASGGSFNYNIAIENTGASAIDFQAWADVMLPNSSWRDLFLRSGLTLAPGASLERSMTQNVPYWAPAGEYEFWGHVGEYPNNPLDEDSFPFEKIAGGFDGGNICTNWMLIGWEDVDGFAPVLPTEFSLSQNYPNPFNPTTLIRFGAPEPALVKIAVYDILGRETAILADRNFEAGYHTVMWDASGLASGIYFIRMESKDFRRTMKMLLLH